MSPETTILLLLPLLGLVHMSAGGGIPRIIEQGWTAAFSARDNLPPIESKYAQRMVRANENFKETLPYAVGLLLLVQVLGVANETSALGAWMYFWSRVAYLPAYYLGIPFVRTGIWTVSVVGLAMVAMPILSKY